MTAGINNEWNREFDPDINIPDIYNFECNYVNSKSFYKLYNSFGGLSIIHFNARSLNDEA